MAFNILIADDSDTMRTVVKRGVKMSGVPLGELYEAANGKEALALLETSWIDVILSDINMPEMGGMELLREVKKTEIYKHIPVIFITTESSQARKEEAEKLGVSGYIKKPFLPEVIKKILYEVLEKAYEHKMDEIPSQKVQEEIEEGMDF